MLVTTKEDDMDPCPICDLPGWHEACEREEWAYWANYQPANDTPDPYDEILKELEAA